MSNERDLALGRYTMLKKQIYELGMLGQSHVESIQKEIATFTSEKDFTSMDFQKVETLAKELQKLQSTFVEKSRQMIHLKETFNF